MIDIWTLTDIQFDGVDTNDYPDFVDAYISHACLPDGTSITDEELEILNEHNSAWIQENVFDSIL